MWLPLYFHGLSPKIYNYSVVVRKTSVISQIRDSLQNFWAVLFKPVIKNKENLGNRHSQDIKLKGKEICMKYDFS